MPLTFTETPLYYKDSQGQYHRILSGADMTGYRTAAAQDAIDAGLVSAVSVQSFTDTQQAQARNNIGAIDAGSIAMIESSPATQAHAVGDYIVYNGQLYKVTAAIAQGESLGVGTNIESTTVGDQFIANNKNKTGTGQTLNAGDFTAPVDGYLLLSTTTGSTSGNRAYAKIGKKSDNANAYIVSIPNGVYAGTNAFYMRKGMTVTIYFEGAGYAEFLPLV